MWKFFKRYPKEFSWLVLIFSIQQLVYYDIMYKAYESESLSWYEEYYRFITGFSIILGGYLSDLGRSYIKALRTNLILILVGGLLIYSDISAVSWIGVILFQLSSCIFFITIFSRIAQYFTLPDYRKVDAFFGLVVLFLIFQSFYSILQIGVEYFISVGASLYLTIPLFLLLFWSFQQIPSTELPIRKHDQTHAQFGWILLLGLTFYFAVMIPYEYFINNFLEPPSEEPSILSYSPIVFWFILLIFFLWNLFRKKKKEIRLINRINIGLGILIVFSLGCFLLEKNNLIVSVGAIFYSFVFINEYFFYAVAIAIVTHNYTGKQMGYVIGVFIGTPYLLQAVVFDYFGNTFIVENTFVIMIVISLLLIIWLHQNKEFLTDFLRLKEAQDVEEIEVEEDPFDHLIQE